MTAVPKNPRVSELRELFRNLNAFRAIFADHGMEDIVAPDGSTWSIWDLEYLHDQLYRLRPRQQQAIILCLIHNMRERDAAVAMGVKETNPVMMYATLGLQRLLDMVDAGELTRYRDHLAEAKELAVRHEESVEGLAEIIRERIRLMSNGCQLYPNAGSGPPLLLLRTPRTASGFLRINPVSVLYRVDIGPVPPGSTFSHMEEPRAFSRACVNPHHALISFSQQYKDHIQRQAEIWRMRNRRDAS
jgi:hypothetical protein